MRPHTPNADALDRRERAMLAPYAVFSRDSRGRKHDEPPHPYRGPFQRDRDRIVHSQAFRRLSGKLQVFTRGRGDYHRTRLTHTMEVASISRTIGRALALNEDLIEALALLHDIGHPPFGHAGEDALANCLPDQQRFSHNQFALTVVEEIERPYARFPGLNLTFEVLAGQQDRVDKTQHTNDQFLEVQVVDLADSITYNAHDCDDAIKLKLIALDELLEIPLVGQCAKRSGQLSQEVPAAVFRREIVRALIDVQVADLIAQTAPQLASSGWTDWRQAARSGFRMAHAAEMAELIGQLENFLHQRVYRHPELIAVRKDARERIGRLVQHLADDPEPMPRSFRDRIERVGAVRAAVEYVAGMTDRYFDQTYERLFLPRTT